ncbi:MAG: hypothetical protein JXN65_06695 [Clostridia bacterium]|nr:hypothetical protein [Clostridia bacterium]
MSLNKYRDEAGRFLEAIGADGEPIEKIIVMLEDEMKTLKENAGDDAIVTHQLYDLIFLLFEIASQQQADLDSEWEKGRKRKQGKYIDR